MRLMVSVPVFDTSIRNVKQLPAGHARLGPSRYTLSIYVRASVPLATAVGPIEPTCAPDGAVRNGSAACPGKEGVPGGSKVALAGIARVSIAKVSTAPAIIDRFSILRPSLGSISDLLRGTLMAASSQNSLPTSNAK